MSELVAKPLEFWMIDVTPVPMETARFEAAFGPWADGEATATVSDAAADRLSGLAYETTIAGDSLTVTLSHWQHAAGENAISPLLHLTALQIPTGGVAVTALERDGEAMAFDAGTVERLATLCRDWRLALQAGQMPDRDSVLRQLRQAVPS